MKMWDRRLTSFMLILMSALLALSTYEGLRYGMNTSDRIWYVVQAGITLVSVLNFRSARKR